MKSLIHAYFCALKSNFLTLFFLLLCAPLALAQHGIGTTTPNVNAALHVDGVEQGVILPKTALASSTHFLGGATATEEDNGMVVYNTATSTLNGLSGEGYYIWQGGAAGSWDRLITAQKGFYANVRTHSLSSRIVWTEDDFCVVVTNHAISPSGNLYLPDATLYPGRVVAIRNAATPAILFGNNQGANAPFTPDSFSAIGPNRGAMFISDGTTWHALSYTF